MSLLSLNEAFSVNGEGQVLIYTYDRLSSDIVLACHIEPLRLLYLFSKAKCGGSKSAITAEEMWSIIVNSFEDDLTYYELIVLNNQVMGSFKVIITLTQYLDWLYIQEKLWIDEGVFYYPRDGYFKMQREDECADYVPSKIMLDIAKIMHAEFIKSELMQYPHRFTSSDGYIIELKLTGREWKSLGSLITLMERRRK